MSSRTPSPIRNRIPVLVAALAATAITVSTLHAAPCTPTYVGTYTPGAEREYVDREIPEYRDREIAEYVTQEIPAYRTREERHDRPSTRYDDVFSIGPYYAEIRPGVFIAVRGMGDRRRTRFSRLVMSFGGERLEIYQAHGFPTHRHRERSNDRILERWTYPEDHRTYVFCGDDMLWWEWY